MSVLQVGHDMMLKVLKLMHEVESLKLMHSILSQGPGCLARPRVWPRKSKGRAGKTFVWVGAFDKILNSGPPRPTL